MNLLTRVNVKTILVSAPEDSLLVVLVRPQSIDQLVFLLINTTKDQKITTPSSIIMHFLDLPNKIMQMILSECLFGIHQDSVQDIRQHCKEAEAKERKFRRYAYLLKNPPNPELDLRCRIYKDSTGAVSLPRSTILGRSQYTIWSLLSICKHIRSAMRPVLHSCNTKASEIQKEFHDQYNPVLIQLEDQMENGGWWRMSEGSSKMRRFCATVYRLEYEKFELEGLMAYHEKLASQIRRLVKSLLKVKARKKWMVFDPREGRLRENFPPLRLPW